MFQFTLPRGERLASGHPLEVKLGVSIHTPARGATTMAQDQTTPTPVSIHAPARGRPIALPSEQPRRGFQFTLPRGERPSATCVGSSSWRFNSRSREGSDCNYLADKAITIVSIHAPARGATSLPSGRTAQLLGFNSRSREGSDRGQLSKTERAEFQFTLPRGERPAGRCVRRRRSSFNSRSREGSDDVRLECC